MKDLVLVNSRIVTQMLGEKPTARQADYLEFLAVCVGRLSARPEELQQYLYGNRTQQNPLPVIYLNRDYLNFARIAAKEAAAGEWDRLVQLGFDVDQAAFIERLTNDEITKLATNYPGYLMSFDPAAFRRGVELHSSAAKFHASAYLAVATV